MKGFDSVKPGRLGLPCHRNTFMGPAAWCSSCFFVYFWCLLYKHWWLR